MRLVFAAGAALAAATVGAVAQADRIVVRHGGPGITADANGDGWITREEASAAAERMFDEFDRNDDGRLDGADHSPMPDFDVRIDAPEVEVREDEDGRRVRIIRRSGDGEWVERDIERAERDVERARREVERAEREAEHAVRDAERRIERYVVRLHAGHDGEELPHPPAPPRLPHPPVFMMMYGNSEEADLDGDGALSREEFRAQQLRFFDASDANRDGRIRQAPPPQPPEPPRPPAPVRPPR